MKFIVSIVACAFALQAYALPAAELQRRTCGYPTVPLLAAYNSEVKDHLYTISAANLEHDIAAGNYQSQGDAAQVLASQEPLTVPFYRLYSTAGKDHFYTTNATERDAFVKKGYTFEWIDGYVYPDASCGTVPLYRAYNPKTIDHFYATQVSAINHAITTSGYVDEGIAAYVNPQ